MVNVRHSSRYRDHMNRVVDAAIADRYFAHLMVGPDDWYRRIIWSMNPNILHADELNAIVGKVSGRHHILRSSQQANSVYETVLFPKRSTARLVMKHRSEGMSIAVFRAHMMKLGFPGV